MKKDIKALKAKYKAAQRTPKEQADINRRLIAQFMERYQNAAIRLFQLAAEHDVATPDQSYRFPMISVPMGGPQMGIPQRGTGWRNTAMNALNTNNTSAFLKAIEALKRGLLARQPTPEAQREAERIRSSFLNGEITALQGILNTIISENQAIKETHDAVHGGQHPISKIAADMLKKRGSYPIDIRDVRVLADYCDEAGVNQAIVNELRTILVYPVYTNYVPDETRPHGVRFEELPRPREATSGDRQVRADLHPPGVIGVNPNLLKILRTLAASASSR